MKRGRKRPAHLVRPATSTRCNGWNAKRKKFCRNPPGKGTDHPREGRCKWHFGNTKVGRGHRSELSRYQDHEVLGDRIKRALDDPKLFELASEVALLVSLQEHLMDERRHRPLDPGEMAETRALARDIMEAKERAKRTSHAWSDVRALQFFHHLDQTLVAILKKHFGEDPRMFAAADEIASVAENFTV